MSNPLYVSPYFSEPVELIGLYGPRGDYPIVKDLLSWVANYIKRLVATDNQAIIMITGAPGSGKSTLALGLIKLLDSDFKLDDVYIYSNNDIKRKLKDNNPQRINLFDEGSVTLNSLATTSKEGRYLSMFFDTMRSRHYISIICVPDGSDIQGRIAKHVNLYLECPKKAPLPGYSARGFFHCKKRTVYKSGKKWDDLIATGVFKPLPKKLKTEYEKKKKEKQDEFIDKMLEDD